MKKTYHLIKSNEVDFFTFVKGVRKNKKSEDQPISSLFKRISLHQEQSCPKKWMNYFSRDCIDFMDNEERKPRDVKKSLSTYFFINPTLSMDQKIVMKNFFIVVSIHRKNADCYIS